MNRAAARVETLSRESLRQAAGTLAAGDASLRRVLESLGPPPMWGRPVSFATFVRIVLEQNVSLASAKHTFERLRTHGGGSVTAANVLELGESGLRPLGFSRQKARYVVLLADEVRRRRFPIRRLRSLPDPEVRAEITSRLGLGAWTADIFLLMALRRPDVFPVGDLALVKGLRELDGGAYDATAAVVERAEAWRPYRSVAARMIWQLYLHNRNQSL